MSIEQQVRDAMHAHADEVSAGPASPLAARAREQAHAMRVRRNAGIAAGVAAVAAIAVGVGTSGILRADPPPEPAPQPDPVVEVASEFAGRTLITSGETHDGEPLFLEVDAPAGSQWMITCTGLGADYVVHRAIDDRFEETAPCGAVHALGQTMSFRYTGNAPAGHVDELVVWITRDGVAVQPEGAVLAAAVYRLPEPVTSIARSDIEPLETALGQEWRYLDAIESLPGERVLTAHFDAEDQDILLEVVTDPVGTDAQVRLLVDGRVAGDLFPLGGSNLGDRLTPGEPHTVTLRIAGDVPADARLGLVRRTLYMEE